MQCQISKQQRSLSHFNRLFVLFFQMLDLMSSHKRELESQCRRYENELQKRDEIMRQTLADREEATNQK